MIIYSWNILYRNKELARAFEFIQNIVFDFFCLQEVPEEFLQQLQTLSFFIVSGIDTEKVFKSTTIKMYNVILSKHPLGEYGEISFIDHWILSPFRTRFFIWLMKPFHFSKTINRGGLYADTVVGEIPVRIFSLHLALAHPKQRFEEFKLAMLKLDMTRKQIVCGDFNILESPHITILNWLLGGRATDALLYKRERLAIEKHFTSHELINPLRNFITHKFSRSQLDHILIHQSFSVTNAFVLKDRIGSDHSIVNVRVE